MPMTKTKIPNGFRSEYNAMSLGELVKMSEPQAERYFANLGPALLQQTITKMTNYIEGIEDADK